GEELPHTVEDPERRHRSNGIGWDAPRPRWEAGERRAENATKRDDGHDEHGLPPTPSTCRGDRTRTCDHPRSRSGPTPARRSLAGGAPALSWPPKEPVSICFSLRLRRWAAL